MSRIPPPVIGWSSPRSPKTPPEIEDERNNDQSTDNLNFCFWRPPGASPGSPECLLSAEPPHWSSAAVRHPAPGPPRMHAAVHAGSSGSSDQSPSRPPNWTGRLRRQYPSRKSRPSSRQSWGVAEAGRWRQQCWAGGRHGEHLPLGPPDWRTGRAGRHWLEGRSCRPTGQPGCQCRTRTQRHRRSRGPAGRHSARAWWASTPGPEVSGPALAPNLKKTRRISFFLETESLLMTISFFTKKLIFSGFLFWKKTQWSRRTLLKLQLTKIN